MRDFVELFESPTFNSYGSSLKLLMVAEGDAHVYPRCAAATGQSLAAEPESSGQLPQSGDIGSLALALVQFTGQSLFTSEGQSGATSRKSVARCLKCSSCHAECVS